MRSAAGNAGVLVLDARCRPPRMHGRQDRGENVLDFSNAANYISSMTSFAPIIQEAWEHRRRRYRAIAIAALASASTVAIVAWLTSIDTGSSGSSTAERGVAVAPSAVLSEKPYMGVSCPVANSIACDRVGLAVSLKHPAESVTATVAGARLPMNYRGDLLDRGDSPRTEFDGFLQPAGIVSRFHVKPVEGNVIYTSHGHVHVVVRRQMWFGDMRHYPAPVSVRLTIHEPGGHTLITHTKVGLATGWG